MFYCKSSFHDKNRFLMFCQIQTYFHNAFKRIINKIKKQKIEQLQTQLDEQLETIRLLKEENDQFKKKITEQARELENYRR